jgi:hypothetical protein
METELQTHNISTNIMFLDIIHLSVFMWNTGL